MNSGSMIGISAPLAVPLAKRGEPKGGGQIMNFGQAIGIRQDRPNPAKIAIPVNALLTKLWGIFECWR